MPTPLGQLRRPLIPLDVTSLALATALASCSTGNTPKLIHFIFVPEMLSKKNFYNCIRDIILNA